MNQFLPNNDSRADQTDWQLLLNQQAFAYEKPVAFGFIKAKPEDFVVTEVMSVEPAGEGEHVWLWIRKVKQNTDQVAKQLARYCDLAYRDVAYSGLKDYFAVTEQWFSLWLPTAHKSEPDWSQFSMDGVEILRSVRHQRKIKRGTHTANQFSIQVTNLRYCEGRESLEQRLLQIQRQGVPNYFGAQRFGRNARNIAKAESMFCGEFKVRDRNLRGIFISAARSHLFNLVLSERIKNDSWQWLFPGEPANLAGSASIFNALLGSESDFTHKSGLQNQRLHELDIHPTAPLWGDFKQSVIEAYPQLHEYESQVVSTHPILASGLVEARIDYQRRATRMRVEDFSWQIENQQLSLNFTLAKGQYATSVLRELILEAEDVKK